MKLQLQFHGDMTIREAKAQFGSLFPYLKIEFFSLEHTNGENIFFYKAIKDAVRLREISTFADDGYISFAPTQAVGAFEQCLQIHFGLPVRVYRKARDFWTKTSGTENLSLQQQNDIGVASCRPAEYNTKTFLL